MERKGYRVAARVESARRRRAEALRRAGAMAAALALRFLAAVGVLLLAGADWRGLALVAGLMLCDIWADNSETKRERAEAAAEAGETARRALLEELLRCPLCRRGATVEGAAGESCCPECGATGETAAMIARNLAREPNTIRRGAPRDNNN